jgi:hypothetical protein
MSYDYVSKVVREAQSILDPWRWRLLLVLGVVIVGLWGYRTIMVATAEKRVGKVCAVLKPGLTMEDALRVADSHGMYKPPYGATLYFMGEKASASHYGCRLEFKDDILRSSTFIPSSRYETAEKKVP